MKKKTLLITIPFLIGLGLSLGIALANGGGAAIQRKVFGGGVKGASGGNVSLRATLGQPAVGTSNGGNVSLGALTLLAGVQAAVCWSTYPFQSQRRRRQDVKRTGHFLGGYLKKALRPQTWKKLLRGGVELYELNKKLTRKQRKEKKGPGGSSKASLHAKSFVFDRKQVFIGSLNLDPRALLHNTEIGVVLKVSEIGEKMAKWFEENIEQLAFRLELKKDENGHEQLLWHGWENGEQVVYTHEPYTGFWRRFGIGFMSIWPIESQL